MNAPQANPPKATAARPESRSESHWYTLDGKAQHTVIGSTTKKPRPTTLGDARKLNLLPSVTTILRLLHKEALMNWKIEQAVLAVMTTPRKPDEPDDAFIQRVLKTEQVQEQEAGIARDKGTQIHDALEMYLAGEAYPAEMKEWIEPVAEHLKTYGKVLHTEKILVGNGYAGRTDLITEAPDCFWLFDYKGTKNLPTKGSWPEHRLQLSAYAKAFKDEQGPKCKPIRTANAYVSSVETGKFIVFVHDSWEDVFAEGFVPLIVHWQWANNYRPLPPRYTAPVTLPKAAAPVAPAIEEEIPLEDGPSNELEKMDTPAIKAGELRGRKVVWTEGVRAATPKPEAKI